MWEIGSHGGGPGLAAVRCGQTRDTVRSEVGSNCGVLSQWRVSVYSRERHIVTACIIMKVKLKLPLCLTKYHVMRTYGAVEV
jgi:hypothetical protein